MPNKDLPEAPQLRKLIGPSFIILALGLGSGEIILWPYLTSHHGLGIAWGAFLGLTFQFFMNMEIERYALARGESVFVGLAKIFRWAPVWFILSTFFAWAIPGIVGASAKVFSHLFGIPDYYNYVAIAFLICIGLILSLGKTVYGMMETLTRTILLIGSPFILILAVTLSKPLDWAALGAGLLGQGDGFFLVPMSISLAVFLGAFAYSGAGGNLNLTQSIYIKEKGYGMGAYAQRISGLFTSKSSEKVRLEGEDFEMNPANLERFRVWWRRINQEHLIVFWGIGMVTILFLMLLAFSTSYGQDLGKDILFVINEGSVIASRTLPIVGTLFLAAVVIMLFQTQLGVLDSTSRIMAENLAIIKLRKDGGQALSLSRIYYGFLWAQIVFGCVLFLFKLEPLSLIVLAAVLNAIAMFVHIGMVNWMNFKALPKEIQPSMLRRAIIIGIFIFFGAFSAVTLWDRVPALAASIIAFFA